MPHRRRIPLKFYGAAFVTVVVAGMYLVNHTDTMGVAAVGVISGVWGGAMVAHVRSKQ